MVLLSRPSGTPSWFDPGVDTSGKSGAGVTSPVYVRGGVGRAGIDTGGVGGTGFVSEGAGIVPSAAARLFGRPHSGDFTTVVTG